MFDIPEDIENKLRQKIELDQALYDKLYEYSKLEDELGLIEIQIKETTSGNLSEHDEKRLPEIQKNIETKAAKEQRQSELKVELLSLLQSSYSDFPQDKIIEKYLPLYFFTFEGYNKSPPEYTIWEQYNLPPNVKKIESITPIIREPTQQPEYSEKIQESISQYYEKYPKKIFPRGPDTPSISAPTDFSKNQFLVILNRSLNELKEKINGEDKKTQKKAPDPLKGTKKPRRMPAGLSNSAFGGKRKPKRFSVKKNKKGKRSKSGRKRSKKGKKIKINIKYKV